MLLVRTHAFTLHLTALTLGPGDGFYLSVWTSIEFHFAVITTSIPAVKPLYVKVVSKLLRGGGSSDSENSKEAPLFLTHESTPKAPVFVFTNDDEPKESMGPAIV